MKKLEIKISITSEETSEKEYVYTDEDAMRDLYGHMEDMFFNGDLEPSECIISERNIDVYKQNLMYGPMEFNESRAEKVAIMFANKYRSCDVSKGDFTEQTKTLNKVLGMLGVKSVESI